VLADTDAPLSADPPRDTVGAHDAGDVLADVVVEDGTPWDEGELSALLENGELTAGKLYLLEQSALGAFADTGFNIMQSMT